MSLIAKLWGAGNEILGPNASAPRSSLHFGADRVRILLFRECERRGRKLLFDSVPVERIKRCNEENNNDSGSPTCRNVVNNGPPKARLEQNTTEHPETIACEHGRLVCEDVSLLSEMIFGTVAMTYRGPSFKIHEMHSPGCLMCTKVFPFSEHSFCRQSERHSSESLGASNSDSNSSFSSLRSNSRPGSGNLSGNSLSPTLRKSSTCSSTGSGWDIDVPRLSSSQSLDDGVSSGSSLSSLRRRWLRVVSTSLGRSQSDESFGSFQQSSFDGSPDGHVRRHKTRLGLALLFHLPDGHERELSGRLMEHAALLEGMLDQLRHSCVDPRGNERGLVGRLYKATSCCSLRLLRLLMSVEPKEPTPLLWHDLLLNSTLPAVPVGVQPSYLYKSLQQMCLLLDELDTKSTNFFLSTIVTAVLTHHLGWVHSAPPRRNGQLIDSLGQQYQCNPLWAQLNDLYGALGTPSRIAHTVIVGDPAKAQLIESVLHLLSYFLRSGLVEKRQESRCPGQEDVHEAIAILERTLRKKPFLERPSTCLGKRSVGKSVLRRSTKQLELSNGEVVNSFEPKSCDEPEKSFELTESGTKQEFASLKKLKRTGTHQKSLNEFVTDCAPNGDTSDRDEPAERQAASKVKIIADEDERELLKESVSRIVDKPSGEETAVSDDVVQSKLAMLRRNHKLNGFQSFEFDSKTPDEQSLAFPSSLGDGPVQEVKAQVYFTLGGEEKPINVSIRDRLKSTCKCQCSYTFTRVPSTSAELPEGVLRKIIQRNFPESSKNMQPPADFDSESGVCFKCRRGLAGSSQNGKLMLETPTNATEVLRGCGNTANSRVLRSNSLEALIEASCVIELPMPRSKKVPPKLRKKSTERVGFSKSLLGTKAVNSTKSLESSYTWGMVVQGFTKKNKSKRTREVPNNCTEEAEQDQSKIKVDEEWWWPIREGLGVEAKFPLIDQPVSEVLCILGDLDTWQVGLLSSNSSDSTPMPVGMSRLVSNMLEAFTYMWKEVRSPEQCIKLLESRLREMWLRSETLAEFLLAADLDDAKVSNLTSFLDVDAADLPLLLAVATTHTPQIAQRFGLTLA